MCIAMPGEDGYEVMKRVRRLEVAHGVRMSQWIPVIALTAMASREIGCAHSVQASTWMLPSQSSIPNW
jgi:CheY-like chemotaxis protein